MDNQCFFIIYNHLVDHYLLKLSKYESRVLANILAQTDPDDSIHKVSISYIELLTRFSKPQINKTIRSLVAKGILEHSAYSPEQLESHYKITTLGVHNE